MKRIVILLLLGWIVFPLSASSQKINLTKLPKEEREKLLFEIATKAMLKYAPSFYRADIKPIIVYEGTVTMKEDKNYGRSLYQVDFPFDIDTDAKEGDDNMYGGHVFIFGDTGKVYLILPSGWMQFFDVEAADAGKRNKVAEPSKFQRFENLRTVIHIDTDSIERRLRREKKEYIERINREYQEKKEREEKEKQENCFRLL